MPQLTRISSGVGAGLARVACALLLAGCAQAPATSAYRAAGAPIYSNAAFDLVRLDGTWQQVASFVPEAGCVGGTARFARDAAGQMQGEVRLCAAGRAQAWSGPVRKVGPGRFTIGEGEAWWVLWDDADNRTLVIGTPSGAFGFVLNRGETLPADRLAAAREILDFNGYDLARLGVGVR